jgi:heme-degrading monooxygenase HmoA
MGPRRMSRFAPLPEPPYYAVIFANQATQANDGYDEMATLMRQLAETMDGYLGIESTRDAGGFAITVSYWRDEAAIAAWRDNVKHRAAQETGKKRWYDHYVLRVAKVERGYEGPEGR